MTNIETTGSGGSRRSKSRLAIIRDYFLGGRGDHDEFDTYRDPKLYDRGAHSSLYRRDNLARGVADVVLRNFPENRDKRILDIGAGTGILSLELARRDMQVVALDLFQLPLEHLNDKAAQEGMAERVQPVRADMNEGLPFADESFPAVVSLRATRYIRNFGRWLSEAHRVLEPGGRLVLPVFAVDLVPWKRHSELGWRQPTTTGSVIDAMQSVGLQVNLEESQRYSRAADTALGNREVPFYYRPTFVVAEKPQAAA